MNIEAIRQNANIVDCSTDGKTFNRVQIWRDEYDYLVALVGQENKYDGFCDEVIEMDYYGEFLPLIEKAEWAKVLAKLG